eukprot:TRINITY_DN8066_c0_g1_i1.p1 TRINITY_DN8066_c0_g1~~TRINITY_DN8066_c0_g1_i1.p1  ORF type:complete len:249 (+),score=96.63 TRINITY_DN8066_c0_g1_i1:66-812(+)
MSSEVKALYQNIVNNVIEKITTILLNEGIEESVINNLRKDWQIRILNSKVLEDSSNQVIVTKVNENNNNNNNLNVGIELNRIPGFNRPLFLTQSNEVQIMSNNNENNTNVEAIEERNEYADLVGEDDEYRDVEDDDNNTNVDKNDITNKNKDEDKDDDDDFKEDDDDDDKEDGDFDEEEEKNEEELGSDLDDEEDIINTDNAIHCIYDNKKRVKRKWRLTLQSGILHIEGRDYIFDSIQAEMTWNDEK